MSLYYLCYVSAGACVGLPWLQGENNALMHVEKQNEPSDDHKKMEWRFKLSFLRYDLLVHHPEHHLVHGKVHHEDHHQLDH